jgi:hypothetical protein
MFFSLLACGGATTQATVSLAPPPASSAPPVVVTASIQTPAPVATSNRPTAIAGTKIRFEGGDGSAIGAAIVIRGATGEGDGVAAEYKYLEMLYGQRGTDFVVGSQSLLEDHGRSFDSLDVKLKSGKTFDVYFDISEYFGKF